jgi:hypothetical protein
MNINALEFVSYSCYHDRLHGRTQDFRGNPQAEYYTLHIAFFQLLSNALPGSFAILFAFSPDISHLTTFKRLLLLPKLLTNTGLSRERTEKSLEFMHF